MAFQRLSGIGHQMTHEVLPRVAAVGLAVGLCTTPQVVEAVAAKASMEATQDRLVEAQKDFFLSQDRVVGQAQQLTTSCYDYLREEVPHGLDSESIVDGISGVANETDSLGPCNLNSEQHLTAVNYLFAQYEYELAATELADAYHKNATAEDTWEQAPKNIRQSALEGLIALTALGVSIRLWRRHQRRVARKPIQPKESDFSEPEPSLDAQMFAA